LQSNGKFKMSFDHFALENEISSVTRMDQPLSTKGPVARWQRKALETSSNSHQAGANASGLNSSSTGNGSKIVNLSGASRLLSGNLALSLSGSKRLNDSTRKTPNKTPKLVNAKTPNKSPGRFDFTPGGSKRSTTPSRNDGGDRFIPSRNATDFETSKFLFLRGNLLDGNNETSANESPSKLKFQKQMQMALHDSDIEKTKIMSYRNKAPTPSEAHQNGLKVLYSQTKSPVPKTARHIPQAPDRILDAPDIVNDYYLNLLDWSSNNHLAVALGPHIYLWNAGNGEIRQLMELESPEDYVCSVRWIKEGNVLAVGNLFGEIALYDVEQMKKMRTMTGHSDRVGSLSWNEYILSSGSRSGKIHHCDVRIADAVVGRINAHSQEVCGLAWSPDGKMLASGGNDNVLNLWSSINNVTQTTPEYSFTQHQAAVKALSWCPWQPNVLASGGGTADRTIRIWNSNNGTLMNTVDTKSQVCSLVWANEYKELVSAHGYANNEVTIWKYPTMVKTAELLGHTERVLHMAISPDGSTIVSAGADETLRLWKCFAPDPNKKKVQCKGKSVRNSLLNGHIR